MIKVLLRYKGEASIRIRTDLMSEKKPIHKNQIKQVEYGLAKTYVTNNSNLFEIVDVNDLKKKSLYDKDKVNIVGDLGTIQTT